MKTLKFSQELVELIRNGSKTVTWRLFDDKDIQKDDVITFIKRPELTPFAEAKVLDVKIKKLSDISEEDKIGHEQVGSDNEMYKKYSEYYNREVTSHTHVKIIRFEIRKFV